MAVLTTIMAVCILQKAFCHLENELPNQFCSEDDKCINKHHFCDLAMMTCIPCELECNPRDGYRHSECSRQCSEYLSTMRLELIKQSTTTGDSRHGQEANADLNLFLLIVNVCIVAMLCIIVSVTVSFAFVRCRTDSAHVKEALISKMWTQAMCSTKHLPCNRYLFKKKTNANYHANRKNKQQMSKTPHKRRDNQHTVNKNTLKTKQTTGSSTKRSISDSINSLTSSINKQMNQLSSLLCLNPRACFGGDPERGEQKSWSMKKVQVDFHGRFSCSTQSDSSNAKGLANEPLIKPAVCEQEERSLDKSPSIKAAALIPSDSHRTKTPTATGNILTESRELINSSDDTTQHDSYRAEDNCNVQQLLTPQIAPLNFPEQSFIDHRQTSNCVDPTELSMCENETKSQAEPSMQPSRANSSSSSLIASRSSAFSSGSYISCIDLDSSHEVEEKLPEGPHIDAVSVGREREAHIDAVSLGSEREVQIDAVSMGRERSVGERAVERMVHAMQAVGGNHYDGRDDDDRGHEHEIEPVNGYIGNYEDDISYNEIPMRPVGVLPDGELVQRSYPDDSGAGSVINPEFQDRSGFNDLHVDNNPIYNILQVTPWVMGYHSQGRSISVYADLDRLDQQQLHQQLVDRTGQPWNKFKLHQHVMP